MSSVLNQSANAAVLAKYLALKQPEDRVQVTYVWNDGRIDGTKCKSRTFRFKPEKPEDLPVWAKGMVANKPDGTEYAIEDFLKPVALYPDPFRGGNNVLAWCECNDAKGNPTHYNTRRSCLQAMDQVKSSHEPWFGIEQEYTLMEPILSAQTQGGRPLGWPINGFPPDRHYDGMYGVGADVVVGREVHEAVYRACLYAGIEIFGENGECYSAQWEYQIGPSLGIACGDDLWMSRHILLRTAEDFRVSVCLDPVAVPGWPPAGAHVNFSTKQMRDQAIGMKAISDAVEKLSLTHEKHMKVYDKKNGEDNKKRLTGGIVTSHADVFTSGIGERTASVRIPEHCAVEGCGYLEDRRPASNIDPYVVTEALIRTCLLNE